MKFRKNINSFQEKLKDIKMINNSNKIWVKANKSKYIYKCDPSEYHILTNKITDNYKKKTTITIGYLKLIR